MKKLLVIGAVLAPTVFTTVIIALALASRDIPPPDFTDLADTAPELNDTENAYPLFLSAARAFSATSDETTTVYKFLEGEEVDRGVLLAVFEKSSEALTFVEHGIERGQCVAPLATATDTSLSHLGPLANIANVMAARARFARAEDRYSEATDACVVLIGFADLYLQAPGSLIEYLMGLRTLNRSCEQVRRLAGDPDIPEEELERLAKTLENFEPLSKGLIRAVKSEFATAVDAVDEFATGMLAGGRVKDQKGGAGSAWLMRKMLPGYVLKPNKTKLLFADHYRRLIGNAHLTYAEKSDCECESVAGPETSKAVLVAPNFVGRILLSLLLVDADQMLKAKCTAANEIESARISVAVAQFKKDHGRRPALLEELAPDYIEAVPEDPFDGQPFRYLPDRGILYSVGANLRDEGGVSPEPDDNTPRKDRSGTGDIVFHIDG